MRSLAQRQGYCNARHPCGPWRCNLPAGHEEDHAAKGYHARVLTRWPLSLEELAARAYSQENR